jgi:hypothetical protein
MPAFSIRMIKGSKTIMPPLEYIIETSFRGGG